MIKLKFSVFFICSMALLGFLSISTPLNAQSKFSAALFESANAGYVQTHKNINLIVFPTTSDIYVSFANLSPIQQDWKPDPGFESLFDGSTLTGWCYRTKEGEIAEKFDEKMQSTDGRYSAKNGILTVNYPVGVERKIQQMSTLREFPRNFILKLEFRASKNADSGIFLRKQQLQCRDYLTAGPYKDLKNYKAQDWNVIVVSVKDNIASSECNGEVLEAAMQLAANGPLGLEGDRGQMEYRHIQIKELP